MTSTARQSLIQINTSIAASSAERIGFLIKFDNDCNEQLTVPVETFPFVEENRLRLACEKRNGKVSVLLKLGRKK